MSPLPASASDFQLPRRSLSERNIPACSLVILPMPRWHRPTSADRWVQINVAAIRGFTFRVAGRSVWAVRAHSRSMHPLILLGLILVVGIFAGLGALVLRLTPWPGLRWASLISFVFSAIVGAGAFAFAYVAIFGDATGALTTTTSMVFLLVGIPLVGSLVGWLGSGAATLISQRIQR